MWNWNFAGSIIGHRENMIVANLKVDPQIADNLYNHSIIGNNGSVCILFLSVQEVS
jgi:hypothetical protein